VNRRRRGIGPDGTGGGGDPEAELRSAICIYLIAERPSGATVGEIARLGLGGERPIVEVPRVSRAVTQLQQEGEVVREGEKVCPVAADDDVPLSDTTEGGSM
jgi:hypothetical protein